MFASCFYIRAICLYLQIKIFPSFLFMWSIVDMLHICESVFFTALSGRVNVLIVPLLMRKTQCCSTNIRSISRLIAQDNTLAIVKLDSIVQQGPLSWHFTRRSEGAFRNKTITIRSFFVLKFPINYIIHIVNSGKQFNNFKSLIYWLGLRKLFAICAV